MTDLETGSAHIDRCGKNACPIMPCSKFPQFISEIQLPHKQYLTLFVLIGTAVAVCLFGLINLTLKNFLRPKKKESCFDGI
jgi:hypothetical protein